MDNLHTFNGIVFEERDVEPCLKHSESYTTIDLDKIETEEDVKEFLNSIFGKGHIADQIENVVMNIDLELAPEEMIKEVFTAITPVVTKTFVTSNNT